MFIHSSFSYQKVSQSSLQYPTTTLFALFIYTKHIENAKILYFFYIYKHLHNSSGHQNWLSAIYLKILIFYVL